MIIFVTAVIIVPIFTNYLMGINTQYTNGDYTTWTGFFGNYFGGIIGGLISGLLTLLGVIATLAHRDKERFLETYYLKTYVLDEVITDLSREFINLQHLPPTDLGLELYKKKPILDEIICRIKADIGGPIGLILMYYRLFSMIENKTVRDSMTLDDSTPFKFHKYIMDILTGLQKYKDSLDKKYNSSKNKSNLW